MVCACSLFVGQQHNLHNKTSNYFNYLKFMKTYDLTSKKGVLDAIATYQLFGFNPILGLAKLALDKLSSSKDQGKIAEELIRKGKENGVKEMEITIDNNKWFGLSVPIEGVNIKAKAGSDEKTHLKVTYK